MFRKRAPEVQPEWLIVGLGNPGPEYRRTRHNVGFDVIELLAERNRIKVDKSRQRALTGTGKIGDVPVALVKPLTFMNASGQSVAPLARHYGVKPERILIIADDLDLRLGEIRLRERGSSGGHNGHKSIIAALGTQDYPRLKIGISKVDRTETVDHVLSRFGEGEHGIVEDAIRISAETIEALVKEGRPRALEVLAKYKQKQD